MFHILKLKLSYQLLFLLVVSTIIISALPAEHSSSEERNNRSSVLGGVRAKKNEFPFLAEIRINKDHHCGGAFVTPEYILTAAHCLEQRFASDFVVYGGEHRIYQWDFSEQKRDAVDKIVHKDYKGRSNGFANDIALLKVGKPFELNEYVKLAKLPRGWWIEPTPTATVMGWGQKRDGGYKASNHLLKVEVPHVENYKCNDQYKKEGGVKDTQLCYGYDEGGKDACHGDSGGPLVCGEDRFLCGIVSKGVGCGRPGKPGIYTEVARYVAWINKNVKK